MDVFEIAIIGGGPAGLSAALYALRAGKSTVIFEGGVFGGTLNSIESIENYPGFTAVSGADLAREMTQQVLRLKPAVVRRFVSNIIETDGTESDSTQIIDTQSKETHSAEYDTSRSLFSIIAGGEEYRAKRIVYCVGARRFTLKAVEEFGGTGISYCAVCDGFFYRGKTVAVIGSGYAAEEDVRYLMPLCKKIYLIGRIKGLEGDNLEQIDDKVVRISGTEAVRAIEFKSGRIVPLEGVFVALGTQSASSILSGVLGEETLNQPLREGRLRARFYVAGDAGATFKQVVWACASGARAATEALKEQIFIK